MHIPETTEGQGEVESVAAASDGEASAAAPEDIVVSATDSSTANCSSIGRYQLTRHREAKRRLRGRPSPDLPLDRLAKKKRSARGIDGRRGRTPHVAEVVHYSGTRCEWSHRDHDVSRSVVLQ